VGTTRTSLWLCEFWRGAAQAHERDEIEQMSEHPLSSLMFMIEMGFYPPPELMLGLLWSWREYLEGGGDISLEEVFLGKPSRKGGNYAMRQAKETKGMWLSHELDKLGGSGMTQEPAAETITNPIHSKLKLTVLCGSRARIECFRQGGHVKKRASHDIPSMEVCQKLP
jgi:hypothetical protein